MVNINIYLPRLIFILYPRLGLEDLPFLHYEDLKKPVAGIAAFTVCGCPSSAATMAIA